MRSVHIYFQQPSVECALTAAAVTALALACHLLFLGAASSPHGSALLPWGWRVAAFRWQLVAGALLLTAAALLHGLQRAFPARAAWLGRRAVAALQWPPEAHRASRWAMPAATAP